MWRDEKGSEASPAAMIAALETMKQTRGIIDRIKLCEQKLK